MCVPCVLCAAQAEPLDLSDTAYLVQVTNIHFTGMYCAYSLQVLGPPAGLPDQRLVAPEQTLTSRAPAWILL